MEIVEEEKSLVEEVQVRIEKNITHLGDTTHIIIKNTEVIGTEEIDLTQVLLAHRAALLPRMTALSKDKETVRTSLKSQCKLNITIFIIIGMCILISRGKKGRKKKRRTKNCFGMDSNG